MSASSDDSAGESPREAFDFLSEVSFWRPNRIRPSAWIEHVPFAFWLVEALQPGYLVELGTHYGTSYAAFCQAVQALGLPSKCYAVDTWKGDEQALFYGEDVFNELAAYNQEFYSGFSTLIRSTFDEASKYFEDGSIDLLHIDGCHTYEAVRHDFDQWLPKLSARAVVLLHDTNVREKEFGVFRLWQELQSRWSSFEFTHGYGLGILGVGDELPGQLQRLFQTKGDHSVTTAIRSVYASLGAGLRLRLEKELQATDFKSHLSRQAQRISALEQELAGSAQRVADKEQRISDLESELVRHRSEIERMNSACRAGEERIAQLERALAQGADNVNHLEREIESLKGSRSWRLTAPLRWVDQRMRRFFTRPQSRA